MRAVIAEDSVLLREGVAGLLRAAGFDVVGCCETAEDLLLKVRSYSPDVAIVDIRLPPTHQRRGPAGGARDPREPPGRSACWCCRSTSSSGWR